MSVKIHPIALLFLAQFLVVQVAEAGLIRNSGRGSPSSQVETHYYFVKNQDLVQFSDSSFGISVEAYAANSILGFEFTNTIGGGGRGISAVPTSGPTASNCNGAYNQDQVNTIQDDIDYWASSSDANAPAELANAQNALDFLINGSPCVWEFEQGEELLAFGAFSMFFDTALIEHQVLWEITGNGLNETLAGSINEGGDIMTPDGIISTGQVMLNTTAPANLLVGDYEITAVANLTSSAGQFFFERTNTGSGSSAEVVTLGFYEEYNPAWDVWRIAYEEWQNNVLYPWQDDPNRTGSEPVFTVPEPAQTISGYRSVNDQDEVRTAETYFRSEPEMLRIVAANNTSNPTSVNAPFSALLLLFGLVGVWLRKRQYS
ncbi:MAG: hypothetical protein NWQ54_11130 [Paraglaciecola sp.]|nr:hypothetical protein [Paraglaciecola sp.]